MSRLRVLVAGVVAVILVACLDVGAPPGGIASYSGVIRPSPSVVVGDDMRDSTGAVAPLRAYAFSESGDTLKEVAISFLSIDTTKPHSITVQPDGHVHGDSVRASVAGSFVVATIANRFQTPPDTIRVTVPPERSKKDDQPLVTLKSVLKSDSLDSANRRALRLTVTGSLPAGAKGAPADTFAVGFIVDYRIISAPASDSGKGVFLINDAGKVASRATTSASEPGVASLKLQFNPLYFPDSIAAGLKTDTVKVEVIVRYNGHAAAQTPDTFVVPFKVGP